jgi:hypothetical protein
VSARMLGWECECGSFFQLEMDVGRVVEPPGKQVIGWHEALWMQCALNSKHDSHEKSKLLYSCQSLKQKQATNMETAITRKPRNLCTMSGSLKVVSGPQRGGLVLSPPVPRYEESLPSPVP